MRYLKITADIGMEGWREVSEAISFKDVDLSLRTKSKNCLASARTEDLTSMWKNPNFHNLVFEEDGGLRVFVTEGFFQKLVDTQANVFPEYNSHLTHSLCIFFPPNTILSYYISFRAEQLKL